MLGKISQLFSLFQLFLPIVPTKIHLKILVSNIAVSLVFMNFTKLATKVYEEKQAQQKHINGNNYLKSEELITKINGFF